MSKTSYPFKKFQADYPNDDACLEAVFRFRFGDSPTCPGCGVVNSKFHRVSGRKSFACQWCGHHVSPCADTIFAKSSTPLTQWFHAIYLMTSTRNGVSAKELERQLGVTYKCAWRIGHELRKLMTLAEGGDHRMDGHVEIDETYVGGKEVNKHLNKRTKGAQGGGSGKTKTVVFGMLERGKSVRCVVVQDVRKETLTPIIYRNVSIGAEISTDENKAYKQLGDKGYEHGTVAHFKKEYVRGKIHINAMEGFWKHLKNGIGSTHIHVSPKHLQKYVNEFSFRYNNRKEPAGMFRKLISSVGKKLPE